MVTARPLIAGIRHRDSNYYLPLICHLYGDSCLRCGVPATVADHVVPMNPVMGGWDWEDNIQPLCDPCNEGRAKKKVEDFRMLSFNVALAMALRPPVPADKPGEGCFVNPILLWQSFGNGSLHLHGFCRCHRYDLQWIRQTALTVRLALPVWNIQIRDEAHLTALALDASRSYKRLSKVEWSVQRKRGLV